MCSNYVCTTAEKKLRQLIIRSGRNASFYSSHSIRRGGASFAFKTNVASELIQQHGDLISDCYKEYLMYDFNQKLSVSRKMCSYIQMNFFFFFFFVANRSLSVTILSDSMPKHVCVLRHTVLQSFPGASIARITISSKRKWLVSILYIRYCMLGLMT